MLDKDQPELAKLCGVDEARLKASLQRASNRCLEDVCKRVADHALFNLRSSGIKSEAEDFGSLPFNGPSAVTDFSRWLESGLLPLKSLDVYLQQVEPIKFFDRGDVRADLVARTTEFLEAQSTRNILVVHNDSMSFGLTAFASYICRELLPTREALKGRPFCYIPFSRGVLEKPTGRSGTRPFRHLDIIGILDGFYRRETVPIPRSNREIRDAVERIRVAMSRQPAILIFDGCRDISETASFLRLLIADDPLVGVLDDLLYPIVNAEGTEDPGVYYDTKIILLSDNSCEQFDLFRYSEEWMHPPESPIDMREFLREYLGKTHSIISRIIPQSLHDETKVGLLDALIRTLPSDFYALEMRQFELQATDLSDLQIMNLLSERLSHSSIGTVVLMALRLCAISDSGIRHVTLARLLSQWAKIILERCPNDFRVEYTAIRPGIEQAVEMLPWIFVEGPDEVIRTLDEHTGPLSYPEMLPDPIAQGWDTAPVSLDIRSQKLRTVVIEEMEKCPDVVRVMHRLLAEECFRQQTIIARHSRWDDQHDIRMVRRSLQGLYHGFKSIARSSTTPMVDLARIPTMLPSDPGDLFRYLYRAIYRAELETPPHWEFARNLGGDRVKVDLLSVALTAGLDKNPRPTASDVQRAIYNILNGSPENSSLSEQDARLVMDLLVNHARAAFHSDNHRAVRWALNIASAISSPTREEGLSVHSEDNKGLRYDRATFSLSKVDIDEVLISEDPESALRLCRYLLNDSGFPVGALDMVDTAAQGITSAREISYEQCDFDNVIDAIVGRFFLGVPSTALIGWSDLLCRYADISSLFEEEKGNREHRKVFVAAFINMVIAERLVDRAFRMNFEIRMPTTGAHATRAFVRICLSLVALCPESDVFFLQQARRQTDVLARSAARYSVERANLLITEARMERVAVKQNLAVPLKLLSEADDQLASVPGLRRARLRLLLERTRLFRLLAVEALKSRPASGLTDAIRRLLDAAAYDANLLRRMARHYLSGYWVEVAESQEREIREICVGADHIPRHLAASRPIRPSSGQ